MALWTPDKKAAGAQTGVVLWIFSSLEDFKPLIQENKKLFEWHSVWIETEKTKRKHMSNMSWQAADLSNWNQNDTVCSSCGHRCDADIKSKKTWNRSSQSVDYSNVSHNDLMILSVMRLLENIHMWVTKFHLTRQKTKCLLTHLVNVSWMARFHGAR